MQNKWEPLKLSQMLSSSYHTKWLNTIKKELGASYVAFEQTREHYRVKVIKDKEVKYANLTGTPQDITVQGYVKLLEQLKKEYEL